MSVLETYLTTLTALRGATVPETSYYATLQILLNDVGAGLRPKVHAVIHPKDSGAGIPDLALFDENQPADQQPAHGVIEAKPVSQDLMQTARGEQVARYVAAYGQVLVTNYYQFVLVTSDPETGRPAIEERFDLAADAKAFWEIARQPRALADAHETALREYLMRVMRRNAPLARAQDVAWILASYAREAKARIEADPANWQTLVNIRQQLEAALGLRFEDESAEEFFRSTLVQTLFYGLFSAWVLWHEKHPDASAKFDLWRDTRRLNVPVISELFAQFSHAPYLPRSVEQVLTWTADALNRVDREKFFVELGYEDAVLGFGHAVLGGSKRLGSEQNAIQYFYEPFLEAFDPDLRRQLGVWYTPREVVKYQVARVDAALKDELGIADGLADPNVYVLDPCCGTGAYLIEVLRHVAGTLHSRYGPALAAQEVQRAIRERIFGFELLPAPFVIAHLQIGLLLHQFEAPLAEGDRAGIYLTNALTGWEPPKEPKTLLMFHELEKERDAADAVKRGRQILVILGNPPYSGYAGIAMEEERDLTNAYRTTRNSDLPRPQGQGLNDLYVRFYRMAERCITEQTGYGVISFISNYSWLDGLSHPGMRERYLEVFDNVYIDNLHGDRIISEYAPDGRTSETVFAMRGSSVGIKVGTAIATMIRKSRSQGVESAATLYYRDWHQARADERRRALLHSVEHEQLPDGYETITPAVEIGLPFKPRSVGANYFEWPLLPELFPVSFPGVKTARDSALVSVDKEPLITRMTHYFDSSVTDQEMQQLAPVLMTNVNRFNAKSVRAYLINRGFLPQQVIRYLYRPLDMRWLYWESETKLLDERREEYYPHVKPENVWLTSAQRNRKDGFYQPMVTREIAGYHVNESQTIYFPLYLYASPKDQLSLFDVDPVPLGGRRPNLSDAAKAYLEGLGYTPDDGAERMFYHALAIMHAPRYRIENAGALRQDWPRVPLPQSAAVLESSAALGQQVGALLDVETPVPGVTQGAPRADLQPVAVLTTTHGPPDFTVNARWGYFGQGNAVMPARGRVVERGDVVDVYLNDSTYWRDIPAAVWTYTLGGYQVLKKWLSYRETEVLGRPLKSEEAREFMHIARRIAALLALNDALDVNYESCKSAAE